MDTYPDFKPYRSEVIQLYQNRARFIWYDSTGLIPFAEILYHQAKNIGLEGVLQEMPYMEILENILNKRPQKDPLIEEELMMSCVYFFYIKLNILLDVDTNSTLRSWINFMEALMFYI